MTLTRSRSLLVAAGFALAAAVVPATAAHADQAPAGGTQLTGPAAGNLTEAPTFHPPVDLIPPGDHPQPIDPPVDDLITPPDQPEPPEPPDPPDGPGDLANPTENPDPEPEPPDDLANPTENPEPEPPDGGDGDQSIPTPERVDSGLGGAADQPREPGVALAASSLVLAVLLLALAASRRRGSTGSAR